MNDFPKVLVIIVTWNKQAYVLELLRSVNKLEYPTENLDIVVVDNASSDETVSAIKHEFPHVHLIENQENIGGTGGFNTGLSFAFEQPDKAYDYLWLLDNDVVTHPRALIELIKILEGDKDIGVAGSTMMQLTTPWRINEIGCFVDKGRGTLVLNRHKEDIVALMGQSVEQLQSKALDLSMFLKDCTSFLDVDYVAAASLVVRASIAKNAGLWDDYFIHFDDVEWCLRIAKEGHRIVASARSVIWHLPAEHKIPTWVLYYDNRNVLYLLEKHSDPKCVQETRQWIKKKALYYAIQGKTDLAELHLQALEDHGNRVYGKKDIALDSCYLNYDAIVELLNSKEYRKILIPWTVNLQSAGLQAAVVRAMKARPELEVDYLVAPKFIHEALPRQIPSANVRITPNNRFRRFFSYLRLRGKYDLIFQSDYQPLIFLSIVAERVLFVNYEGASLRERPSLSTLFEYGKKLLFP